MSSYSASDSDVFRRFFEPAFDAYTRSANQYACRELSDREYLELGVCRVISDSRTGRDFLQRHADFGRKELTASHLGKALKSRRRLSNIASINLELADTMKVRCVDPYAAIPELSKFAVFAGDGHFHGAAAHDPKLESSSGDPRKFATGHFFLLDQRTHHVRHLATAEQGGTRKGEHDMRVIKRTEIEMLRGHEPKGRKVIIAWDPAGIDLSFWIKAKRSHGLYFISRAKDTINLTTIESRSIDPQAAENTGVLRDETVMPANGQGPLRRIVYEDIASGRTFTYLTTEMTLPAWVLVLIYKHRWDIEKVFDEFKNKLYERKSWACGPTAKAAHAQFLCLAHNLMVLFEGELEQREGITDSKELSRRRARMEEALENGASFIATLIQRFTVRPLRFIRWLRNHLYQHACWDEAVDRLRHIYATY